MIIAVLFLIIWKLVYLSGGTAFVHVHLIYVPIILGAFYFGVPGGVVAGVIGMVLMGPLMPLNVSEGVAQPVENWLMRGAYLSAFGGLVGMLRMVIRRRDRTIFEEVLYDTATDLPRLTSFLKEASGHFSGEREDEAHSLIHLEIANAKELILGFGSDSYDKAIREAASRLERVLPESAVLGRSGLNELTLFLPEMGRTEAYELANRLVKNLESLIEVAGAPFYLDMEAGMASAPEDGEDPHALLRAARAAVADGRPKLAQINSFNRQEDQLRKENLERLAALKLALANRELLFHAQPKALCQGLGCCGAELLVRWPRPDGGFTPPGLFIPLAEKSRLVSQISWLALESAIGYAHNFRELLGDEADFQVAVNLSPEELRDPDFPSKLASLFRTDLHLLKHLEVEVTETAIMSDLGTAIEVLRDLRDMSVKVAIDDFGTGYASLSYLRDIPADALKLDQSFIKTVASSDEMQSLVRLSMGAAREYGMKCVAEGVEDEETYLWLRDNGCHMIQGYWYARPQSLEDTIAWVRRSVSAVSS